MQTNKLLEILLCIFLQIPASLHYMVLEFCPAMWAEDKCQETCCFVSHERPSPAPTVPCSLSMTRLHKCHLRSSPFSQGLAKTFQLPHAGNGLERTGNVQREALSFQAEKRGEMWRLQSSKEGLQGNREDYGAKHPEVPSGLPGAAHCSAQGPGSSDRLHSLPATPSQLCRCAYGQLGHSKENRDHAVTQMVLKWGRCKSRAGWLQFLSWLLLNLLHCPHHCCTATAQPCQEGPSRIWKSVGYVSWSPSTACQLCEPFLNIYK